MEYAAVQLVTPEISGAEALRQLSLLGEAAGRYCKSRGAVLKLQRCTTRCCEVVGGAMIARAEAHAKIDVLTGLGGRAAYSADLEGALRRVQVAGTVVLAMMDLNGLRIVNNDINHTAGDTYLKYFAVLLNDAIRHSDARAYRVSGDEFYVLFRDVAPSEAERALSELVVAGRCPPVSFGVAEAPAEGNDREALEVLAEDRMKGMKHVGSEEDRFGATRDWLASDHWTAAQEGF